MEFKKIKMNQIDKNHLFLICYLFIFLYAPPILVDFNLVFILFLFSIVQIVRKYKKEIKLILINMTIKKFLFGICIYSIYFFGVLLINFFFFKRVNILDYLNVIYSFILFFPITLICSFYVICYCIDKKIDLDGLIHDFILACLIQSLICILTLLFRDFKELLLSIMYKHTHNDLLMSPWLNHRRFFGFSRNLLDLFGLGTGIMCGIAIIQLNKHKKYIYYIPFMFILTFLNAKTGLIITALAILLFMINGENRQLVIKYIKKYKYILLISIIGVLLVIYIFSPNTFNWVINDFLSFIPSAGNEGIGSLLFSKDFWSFPNNVFVIIFGTGHNIFAVQGFPHSDVGYVNEIWKTGIIGFIILYGSILLLFIKMIKSKTYLNKYLGILFLTSFLLFMIKGQVIGYNPATPVLFTISLYAILVEK